MNGTGVKVEGLNDLQYELKEVIRIYHDIASDRLEDTGKKFMDRVIQLTGEYIQTDTDDIVQGFVLDELQDDGDVMKKSFRSTAEKFYLIENGYNQVMDDGITVWIPGKHIIEQVKAEYQDIFSEGMQKMADDILKGCGLN